MTDYTKAINDVFNDPAPLTPAKPEQIDYAKAVQEQTEYELRQSMLASTGRDPDTEAKLQKIADYIGAPIDSVRLDPAKAEQQARLNGVDYPTLVKDSPATSAFLTDPNRAAVAHDDVKTMSVFEKSLRALGSSVPQLNQGLWGVAQAATEAFIQPLTKPLAGTLLPEDIGARIAAKFAQFREEQKGVADNLLPQTDGVASSGYYSGLQSLGQSLLTVPMAIMTGNPALALAPLVAQTGGDAYAEARKKGIGVNPALTFAASQATIEYATEKLPLGKLLGDLKEGTPFFKTLLHNLALEIPGEQIATVLQDLNEWATLNPDRPFADYMKERPSAAAQTLVATIVSSGGQVTVTKGLQTISDRINNKTTAAHKAELDAQAMAALNELAAQSKLRQRDPSGFEAFVQQATEDGPVKDLYINVNDLAQSGVDLTALAQASPTIAQQLPEAMATSGDVRVPIEEFAAKIAGTDFAQSLIPHLRTDPEGMSQVQAQAYMQNETQELQAEIEQVLTEQSHDEAFKASRDEVTAQVKAQLNEAGRFTDDVNGAYATLMGNFYAVQAAKLGITPQEMAARYPVQVRAQMPTTGDRALDQTETTPANEATTGKMWYGTLHRGVSGVKTDAGDFGKGIYYTGDRSIAEAYARGPIDQPDRKGEVITREVRLTNPLVFKTMREARRYRRSVVGDELINRSQSEEAARLIDADLRSKGYDGVVVYDSEKQGTVLTEVPIEVVQLGSTDGPSILSQNKRGSITMADDITQQPSVITLLERADLSTFLHESGHFYLEVLNDIANRADAPQEVKDDMSAVLRWFKIENLDTWNALPFGQKVQFHEKFARGFEAYLFEGQSPNVELNGLFQKFRAWLLNVYRSLSSLDVKLSTEVRGVFDRMLASADAIAEAETVRNYGAMFTTKPDVMSDEEWASYRSKAVEASQDAAHTLETRSLANMQWLRNARSRLLSKLQRAAKTKRDEVRAEVEAEVLAEPIYRARAFLTHGTFEKTDLTNKQRRILDDASMRNTKLSLPVLKEMYGEGPTARWRYLPAGKYGMVGEEGLNPDLVAELFGFKSGDEMVRGLIASAKPGEKIEGLTDQRMLEKYGDMVDKDSLDRAVDEALYNDMRLRTVATDLNVLNKLLGNKQVLAKAAKSFAEATIGRQSVKTLRPSKYSAAAARAAKAADVAFKKGDLATAAREKQNQLINSYATKAAYEARDELRRMSERFRKMVAGKDDVVAKTRDMDVVQAVRAALAEYGIGKKGQKALDYLTTIKGNDEATYLFLRDTVDAMTANAKPLNELSIDQARTLRDQVESMWGLSKRMRQVSIDGALIDRKEVEEALKNPTHRDRHPDQYPRAESGFYRARRPKRTNPRLPQRGAAHGIVGAS
jgi:hypothetical protein